MLILADPILADGQQLLVGTESSSQKLAAPTGIGEKVRPFIDICHLSCARRLLAGF
jgi:hypothetical protein